MLKTTTWPGSVDDYVDALVWLVGELLTDPRHFFRSFTVKEPGRLMTARPADLHTHPRDGYLQEEGFANPVPMPRRNRPHPRH